jgi:hypothetical protein
MRFFLAFILIISPCTYARHSSKDISEQLRNKIKLTEINKNNIHVSIILPVSRGFKQKGSNLCWVFATLNALETNYLVRHPESHIELSRGSMQYLAMEDRFKNYILGYQDNMSEGGLEIEAINLIQKNGLVHFNDYHDYVSWQISEIRAKIETTPQKQKMEVMQTALSDYLGPLPAMTQIDGFPLDRFNLGTNILDQEWVELYASEEMEGWFKEPDPDSRYNTDVYFTKKQNLIEAMKSSLLEGYAFTWGTSNHAMMIYGADFNEKGSAIAYYVKDTSEPYTYVADAETVHQIMLEVTVLKKFMP